MTCPGWPPTWRTSWLRCIRPTRPAGRRRASTTGTAAARWTITTLSTREALQALRGHIDTALAAEIWQAALKSPLPARPVWFHGDAQPGNLLLTGGRLSAVIDFGTSGIGDPSCDTTIAWTFFSGDASRVFAERLPVDSATWVRGRGWAIWKAMIVLAQELEEDPEGPRSPRA